MLVDRFGSVMDRLRIAFGSVKLQWVSDLTTKAVVRSKTSIIRAKKQTHPLRRKMYNNQIHINNEPRTQKAIYKTLYQNRQIRPP